ncbi:MAG: hypothetical protein ABWY02_14975 [Telluria sp.]
MTLTAVDAPGYPGPSATTPGEARFDARQRMIVDDAIALLGSSNIMSVFEYLRTRDIGIHVIERVLLEPMERHSTT